MGAVIKMLSAELFLFMWEKERMYLEYMQRSCRL